MVIWSLGFNMGIEHRSLKCSCTCMPKTYLELASLHSYRIIRHPHRFQLCILLTQIRLIVYERRWLSAEYRSLRRKTDLIFRKATSE